MLLQQRQHLQQELKNLVSCKKKNHTMDRREMSKTTRSSKMLQVANKCLSGLDKYLFKRKLRHQALLRIGSWFQIWRNVPNRETLASMIASCSMQPWWGLMKIGSEVSLSGTLSRGTAKSTIRCRPLTLRAHLRYKDDSRSLKPCVRLSQADLVDYTYQDCLREVSLESQKMSNSCPKGAFIWSNSWKKS